MNWVFVLVVGGSIVLALAVHFAGKLQQRAEQKREQEG
jgi:hypothetical protein